MLVARLDSCDMLNNPSSNSIAYTIYFAGCTMRCKGCYNQQLWNAKVSKNCEYMTPREIVGKIPRHYDYKDIVLLGGDPIDQSWRHLVELCNLLHSMGYRIWLYTGREFDDERVQNLLPYLYFAKTGKFDETKFVPDRIPSSTNQRVFMKFDNIWKECIYNENQHVFTPRV